MDSRKAHNLKKADPAFTVYFILMALFYTNTYIQLFAQLGILLYVAYVVIFCMNTVSKRRSFRNVRFLLCWFGLFALWAAMSKMWAYSVRADSSTILTLSRMLAIGVALFMYASDYNKAISVTKSFIIANVFMVVVALLTTPLSQYGKAGEEGFGTLIGQHRNAFGAAVVFLVLICLIFYRYENLKCGKHLAAFFVLALLCSGSRGAMLQIVIIGFLYVATMPGMKKKVKYIMRAIIVVIVAVVILNNVPYLYETVWIRFENMFSTILGVGKIADSSTYGRELYKVLAWDMFEKRPWLGYGVDGFYCMLRDVEYVNGYYLPPKYSHCNFTEIAANFGIIGMAIWYLPIFYMLFKSFKLRKKAPQMNMVFIVLTSMVILDYARIPWSTHSSIYTYFCIILLFLWTKFEIQRKQLIKLEFGTL